MPKSQHSHQVTPKSHQSRPSHAWSRQVTGGTFQLNLHPQLVCKGCILGITIGQPRPLTQPSQGLDVLPGAVNKERAILVGRRQHRGALRGRVSENWQPWDVTWKLNDCPQ
eukprot:EG_transcript_25611